MKSRLTSERDNLIFTGILAVIMIVCVITNYGGDIDNYNTTILALNYTYGFISRGFIGTLFLLCDKVLPMSLLDARGASLFLHGCTIVFFVVCLVFAYVVVRHTSTRSRRNVQCILILLTICIATTFASDSNLGRVDMFMIEVSLIAAMLIFAKRLLWLVPIMSALAVMIHQGYVLMYFNIVLVMLCFRLFTADDRRDRVRYSLIIAISIIVSAALFFYLELYSHPDNGMEIYESVMTYAKGLSYSGTAHETLIAHEILGVDLSEVEHGFHMKNLAEIIIFAVITIPYIVFFILLFRKLMSTGKTIGERLTYLAFALGSLTMLPDFLIKVDYGRWMLAVSVYYMVILLMYMIMDTVTEEAADALIDGLRQRGVWGLILFVYPAILLPYYDVNIDQITAMVGHVANRELLHWW